jgi:uncharacterized protein
MPEIDLHIRIISSLTEVSATDWNDCLKGTQPNTDSVLHPFMTHAFLYALEASHCTGGRTGWNPSHILVESKRDGLLAAAPCFIKTHSQGEYVFDHAWAEAYARAGGNYYPKLQVSAPFSPVTGPRLLVRQGPLAEQARVALVQGLSTLRERTKASSIHATFLSDDDKLAFERQDFLIRTDQQFHWQNAGYKSFDEFLAALSSRKRKMIRKERLTALANGITITRLSGADLTEAVWDDFYAFYVDTGSRKWGRPYLTRRFFSEIGRTMPEQILLVMASREGKRIAGAINFLGQDTLYGRNWGCIEDHPCLHFEVCYYQAIDYAIEHGLARVEAGAQGEHKLARGYLPVTTYSAHEIADPRLRDAVADYLRREQTHVAKLQQMLTEEGPFKQANEPRAVEKIEV